ncbi:MAG: hypothetical protein L6R36_005828 [Xanthoria steineri]|nr:MAG: hypothetical protein L6R36_005828 [Xanthoria steineri]
MPATTVEEDGGPKKRRRTKSPEAETPAQNGYTMDDWERQLGVAAQPRPSSSQKKLIPAEVSLTHGRSSLHAEGLSNHSHQQEVPDPLLARHQVESKQTNTLDESSMQLEHPSQPGLEVTSGVRNPKKNKNVGTGRLPIEMPGVAADVLSRSKKMPAKSTIKARPATSSPTTLKRSTRLALDSLQNPITETNSEQAPRKMMKVRADGRLTSPKSSKLEGKSVNTETEEDSLSIDEVPRASPGPPKSLTPTRQTAPKKLMKIRSDGKLASPSSHTQPEEAEKKRRGRPKKSAAIAMERIVVIKYGKTDSSRHSVGQRIELILSDSKERLPATLASSPAPKPTETLKTTHPFFLRKLAKQSESESGAYKSKIKSDLSTDKQDPLNSSVSNAKRTSPRKPAAKATATPWACVGAFGQAPSMSGDPAARKTRGTVDAIWPPQDMVHIRQLSGSSPAHGYEPALTFAKPSIATKLKDVRVKITEGEEVLHRYNTLVKACRVIGEMSGQDDSQPKSFRLPSRRVMEGPELQRSYRSRSSAQASTLERTTDMKNGETQESSEARHERIHSNPALLRLYDRIAISRTAFDRFECEIQDWQQKYAPRRAEEVLQPGREALILRDWLRSLAVNAIVDGSTNLEKVKNTAGTVKKQSIGLRRKKRHRAEELDGFVVSSDEEANEMDEIDDGPSIDPSQPRDDRKRTEIKAQEAANLNAKPGSRQKASNATIISGPCGCGKTAAIYAATQELGFEVFEINAGSRRSGKDILDKVGDMSRNHLVSQPRASDVDQRATPLGDDLSWTADTLKQDIETGRQGTMSAFLQPKKVKKKSGVKSKLPKEDDANGKQSKQKAQKQSVILLEEVDVLFEEDKQFWTTTMDLIVQSKRPVIMTCTDETLLPLDDLPLFGVLRFRKPPEQLASEYLSLLACNEGHLLSREAVSALYRAKDKDLRASITELQFFCQMGIGDSKGGLEWLLIRSAAETNEDPKQMRVVSDGTYSKGMGWMGQEWTAPGSAQQIDAEIDNFVSVCNYWGIDVAEQDGFMPLAAFSDMPADDKDKRRTLESLDLVHDALSAADTLRYSGFRSDLGVSLEVSAPPRSEKQRANYVEGTTLLEADLQPEPSGISDSIASALRICARRTFVATAESLQDHPLPVQSLTDALPGMMEVSQGEGPISREGLHAAFLPLSKPSVGSSAGRGPLISSLDSQVAVVAEDIAPYIRSIVWYDLRLEQHRKQLELAFHGERSSKRARTTRASRAALEGGSKANTRRERWFPANTDFQAVLESGGVGWQEEAFSASRISRSDANDDSGASRRLSAGSIESVGPGGR